MKKRSLPEAFKTGILEINGGTLHPGKLLSGLKAKAIRAGVQIFENTGVTEIRKGGKVTLKTGRVDKFCLSTRLAAE